MGTAEPDEYDAADWDAWRRSTYKTILDLRAQGRTYYDIGQQLRISASYASVLEKRARPYFYQLIATPPKTDYAEPHPPRLSWMDLYTLYPLKDFLTELANDNNN